MQIVLDGEHSRNTIRTDERIVLVCLCPDHPNQVHMTAKGRKTAAEISRLKKAMARDVFGDLSQADAHKVVELLRQAPTEQDK